MKHLVLVVIFALPALVFADGHYEGVWVAEDGSYSTVNQNGSSIVVVVLSPADLTFSAYQGLLSGNQATLHTVLAGASVSMRVEFTSETTAIATLLSCTPSPGYACAAPNGAQMSSTRIF